VILLRVYENGEIVGTAEVEHIDRDELSVTFTFRNPLPSGIKAGQFFDLFETETGAVFLP